MQELTKLALSKVMEKQIKGLRLEAGSHMVDEFIHLHVKGEIKKSEDTEYTPTVDIPLLPTIALFLEKMGFVRDAAERMLVEAMTEAVNLSVSPTAEMQERMRDVESAMDRARRIVGELPRKVRQGQTRVNVEVEELNMV